MALPRPIPPPPPPQSALEATAAKFRQQLAAVDGQATQQLLDIYAPLRLELVKRADELAGIIAAAQASGEVLSPAKAFQLTRVNQLLAETRAEYKRLAGLAAGTVSGAQLTAAQQAVEAAKFLAAASGAAPGVIAGFAGLPTTAIEELTGRLQNGSPLRALFDDLGDQASASIRTSLTRALALGLPPRDAAREIVDAASGVTVAKATQWSRDALIGAYHGASLATYQANSDVIEGWIWTCARQPGRTCLACIANDGRVFPLDETLPRHSRCRCTMRPKVIGMDDDLEPASAWFNALPENQKRSWGPGAFELLSTGKVILADFVHKQWSPSWGRTWREASLVRAQLNAAKRTTKAAQVAPPPAPPPLPAAFADPGIPATDQLKQLYADVAAGKVSFSAGAALEKELKAKINAGPVTIPDVAPPGISSVPWAATMDPATAASWAKAGGFPGQTFFHFTSEAGADAIKAGGFAKKPGKWGRGVYLTSGPEPGTTGALSLEGRLQVAVQVQRPFITTEASFVDDVAKVAGTPPPHSPDDVLLKAGYDSIILRDPSHDDWLIVLGDHPQQKLVVIDHSLPPPTALPASPVDDLLAKQTAAQKTLDDLLAGGKVPPGTYDQLSVNLAKGADPDLVLGQAARAQLTAVQDQAAASAHAQIAAMAAADELPTGTAKALVAKLNKGDTPADVLAEAQQAAAALQVAKQADADLDALLQADALTFGQHDAAVALVRAGKPQEALKLAQDYQNAQAAIVAAKAADGLAAADADDLLVELATADLSPAEALGLLADFKTAHATAKKAAAETQVLAELADLETQGWLAPGIADQWKAAFAGGHPMGVADAKKVVAKARAGDYFNPKPLLDDLADAFATGQLSDTDLADFTKKVLDKAISPKAAQALVDDVKAGVYKPVLTGPQLNAKYGQDLVSLFQQKGIDLADTQVFTFFDDMVLGKLDEAAVLAKLDALKQLPDKLTPAKLLAKVDQDLTDLFLAGKLADPEKLALQQAILGGQWDETDLVAHLAGLKATVAAKTPHQVSQDLAPQLSDLAFAQGKLTPETAIGIQQKIIAGELDEAGAQALINQIAATPVNKAPKALVAKYQPQLDTLKAAGLVTDAQYAKYTADLGMGLVTENAVSVFVKKQQKKLLGQTQQAATTPTLTGKTGFDLANHYEADLELLATQGKISYFESLNTQHLLQAGHWSETDLLTWAKKQGYALPSAPTPAPTLAAAAAKTAAAAKAPVVTAAKAPAHVVKPWQDQWVKDAGKGGSVDATKYFAKSDYILQYGGPQGKFFPGMDGLQRQMKEASDAKTLTFPVFDLPLDKVSFVATQHGMSAQKLGQYVQNLASPSYPRAIVWKGEYYLTNGHHRVAAAHIRGEASLKVQVIDLDQLAGQARITGASPAELQQIIDNLTPPPGAIPTGGIKPPSGVPGAGATSGQTFQLPALKLPASSPAIKHAKTTFRAGDTANVNADPFDHVNRLAQVKAFRHPKPALQAELTPQTQAWQAVTPQAQVNALRDYTGSAYYAMNKRMRSGLQGSTTTDKKIAQAEDAFNRDEARIPLDLKLFRGTGFSSGPRPPEIENAAPGDVIGFLGMDSYSSNQGTARGFASGKPRPTFFEVFVPERARGLYLKPISQFSSEEEVLFPRGTRLLVHEKVVEPNGMVKIVGEILIDE